MVAKWTRVKFLFYPKPNSNGSDDDINKWDVGPFQLNIYWTLKAVEKGEVSFSGLNELNVFGYNFYQSDGVTPAPNFSGSPLANARMGARRLHAIGGSDRNKAIKYTAPASQPARGQSYDGFAKRFKDFFTCYHP